MTASPPPWLSERHPEVLPQDADGVRRWPGSRQHFCPSSPVYREHAVRLVTELATRYGTHPALESWHIGNEYGCSNPRCYCDVSAADFRRWLRERYGTVEALNTAWATTFWSQRYDTFEQVLPPRTTPTHPNPAQVLDYARFCDDALLQCYLAEKEALRRITPACPSPPTTCRCTRPSARSPGRRTRTSRPWTTTRTRTTRRPTSGRAWLST